ncbi:MAG: NAD(P)(+) transhydrogenase (Re/Si-specific) subunit beta [Treponema sp.]|nr:NAD(P)(+) transhydrogenase (Re/Si-specific) subunit beta [Treponema sp.]
MKKLIVPAVEALLFVAIAALAVFVVPDMDRKVADWFQRPLKPLEERRDVIMINVDDGSIDAIGTWPFGRDVYAGMLDVLKDFETEAVVFDLSFLDKSQRKVDEQYLSEELPQVIDEGFSSINTGIGEMLSGYANESLDARDAEKAAGYLLGITEDAKENLNATIGQAVRDVDAILADSIQFFENAYLTLTIDDAYPVDDKEEKAYIGNYISLKNVASDGDTVTYDYKGVLPTIVPFMVRARSAGFVNASPDKDGYLRRLPLVLKIDGKYYGQFVLVPILRRFGNPQVVVSNGFVTLKGCRLDDGSVRDIKIPRDEQGCVIVKYPPKRYSDYNSISLWDIYRLALLDELLYKNVASMEESGLFDLWDGADPVELYQSARSLKEQLSKHGEDADGDITYANYTVYRSAFYGTIAEFLESDQEQRLAAAFGDEEYIHDVFATVREQYADVSESRRAVQQKVKNADEMNPQMSNVDVAIVIGANDVVNPDAINDESSPLYGMPIVNAHEARTVFVLKRGKGTGFSGVENPLFTNDNTVMIYGDAKATVSALVSEFNDA